MIQLYNPKKYSIEKPIEPIGDENEFSNCRFKGAVYNLRSYYTSIKRVSELVEEPNQYTHIIRTRVDILIHSMPLLFLPDRIYTRIVHPNAGIDNAVLIYPSEYFYALSSIIDNLIPLYRSGVVMNDEEMLHGHLTSCGLLDKTHGSSILHDIIRV